MRILVGSTCVAILAAISHYFWTSYAESRERHLLAIALHENAIQSGCDKKLRSLKAWKNGTPLPGSTTFANARMDVENCFSALAGSDWAERNKDVIYW